MSTLAIVGSGSGGPGCVDFLHRDCNPPDFEHDGDTGGHVPTGNARESDAGRVLPIGTVMLVVDARLGAWLWRAPDDPFTLGAMAGCLRHASLGECLHRFGWIGVHAFTTWALTAPVLSATLPALLRPALRSLALRRPLP